MGGEANYLLSGMILQVATCRWAVTKTLVICYIGDDENQDIWISLVNQDIRIFVQGFTNKYMEIFSKPSIRNP